MGLLDKLKFRKKTSAAATLTTESDNAVPIVESESFSSDTQGDLLPPGQKRKISLTDFVSSLTVPKLLAGGVVLLIGVFVLHAGIGAYMDHKEYLKTKAILQQQKPKKLLSVKAQHFSQKLPPVDLSADNFYQGLAKLSEFSTIRVHFLSPEVDPSKRMQTHDAMDFTKWARPIGIVKNIYSGKVTVVLKGPVSVVGIMLPQIHTLFIRNSGILESVEFSKDTSGRSGSASTPKLILSGSFYGAPPRGLAADGTPNRAFHTVGYK